MIEMDGLASFEDQVAALEDAGIVVAPTPADMGDAVAQAIAK